MLIYLWHDLQLEGKTRNTCHLASDFCYQVIDLHTLRKKLSYFGTFWVSDLKVKMCGPIISSLFALIEVELTGHQHHV